MEFMRAFRRLESFSKGQRTKEDALREENERLRSENDQLAGDVSHLQYVLTQEGIPTEKVKKEIVYKEKEVPVEIFTSSSIEDSTFDPIPSRPTFQDKDEESGEAKKKREKTEPEVTLLDSHQGASNITDTGKLESEKIREGSSLSSPALEITPEEIAEIEKENEELRRMQFGRNGGGFGPSSSKSESAASKKAASTNEDYKTNVEQQIKEKSSEIEEINQKLDQLSQLIAQDEKNPEAQGRLKILLEQAKLYQNRKETLSLDLQVLNGLLADNIATRQSLEEVEKELSNATQEKD